MCEKTGLNGTNVSLASGRVECEVAALWIPIPVVGETSSDLLCLDNKGFKSLVQISPVHVKIGRQWNGIYEKKNRYMHVLEHHEFKISIYMSKFAYTF